MMRIAVTGASGQIGSQVVRLLAGEQAHQVVALSRRVPPSGRWLAGVCAGAADYSDPEALSTGGPVVDVCVLDDVRLDPGATPGGSQSCHWSMPVPQPPRPAGSQIAASPGIRTPW